MFGLVLSCSLWSYMVSYGSLWSLMVLNGVPVRSWYGVEWNESVREFVVYWGVYTFCSGSSWCLGDLRSGGQRGLTFGSYWSSRCCGGSCCWRAGRGGCGGSGCFSGWRCVGKLTENVINSSAFSTGWTSWASVIWSTAQGKVTPRVSSSSTKYNIFTNFVWIPRIQGGQKLPRNWFTIWTSVNVTMEMSWPWAADYLGVTKVALLCSSSIGLPSLAWSSNTELPEWPPWRCSSPFAPPHIFGRIWLRTYSKWIFYCSINHQFTWPCPHPVREGGVPHSLDQTFSAIIYSDPILTIKQHRVVFMSVVTIIYSIV